jgi:hypothetical protein
MTEDGKLQRRGEFVWVTYSGKTVKAMCLLVSDNGVSAVIMFDAMLGGHLGMMPIVWTVGHYESLLEGLPLTMTPWPS